MNRMALADLVLAAHALIAALILCAPLVLLGGRRWRWARDRRLRTLQAALAAFVFCNTALGRPCPLTTLEQRLRGGPPKDLTQRALGPVGAVTSREGDLLDEALCGLVLVLFARSSARCRRPQRRAWSARRKPCYSAPPLRS